MCADFEEDRTQAFSPLTSGELVSHYRVVQRIDAGGMGEVYLAEDTKLQRQVALKFMLPQHAASPVLRERFRREAQSSATLSHPNITTIFEVSEHEGRPFFAMEHVTGKSLREMLAAETLSIDQCLTIAVQICDGLQAAHEAGVVHRDIKPGNIRIDDNGRIKLLDFGLAAMRGEQQLTVPGQMLGTVGYMAPEQIKGDTVDHRADIFAVGVVLYELFTGYQPFRREYEAATLQAVLNEAAEPVTQHRTDVPVGLQAILAKALEKDPAKRYQSVGDMASDLRLLKEGIPPPLPPWIWQRKTLVATVAAIILVAAVVNYNVIFRWLGISAVPEKKHLVVLPFANVGSLVANQAFCDGLRETLTSKLTQLEQFHGSFWVVPASEVLQKGVASVRDARSAFGATLAITGSVQQFGDRARITLNLVDASTQLQLRSTVIDDPLSNVAAFQDSTVLRLTEMLEMELEPSEQQTLVAGNTAVPEAYEFYLRGRGLMSAQSVAIDQIDSAIGLFKNALAKDPRYALAYAGLGESYWEKFQVTKDTQWVDEAISNGQIAVRLNDQLAPVHATLGRIHQGTGHYEEGVKDFQRALQLDSASHGAYQGLAITYDALGDFDRAEAAYQAVIRLNPEYYTGNLELGMFYFRRGQMNRAVQQLEKALALEPKGYIAWNNLGALSYYLGRRDEARTAWNRSRTIQPNYAACSNLGALYWEDKRFVEAADLYEEALEMDSLDYNVWINVASAYRHIPGADEKSDSAYRQAIRLAEEQRAINPRNPFVLLDLADCYSMTGEPNLALNLIEQALAISSNDIIIMKNAGIIYEQLGKRELAIKWIRKALEAGELPELVGSLPELEELIRDPRMNEFFPDDTI